MEQEISNNLVNEESMMDRLIRLLPEIDVKTGVATSCNDIEFYLEIFKDFSELPIKKELKQFVDENDYKNYCIRIHGFKNNAYTIGAKELGDLAFKMECLTKECISDEIHELQERLFVQYDKICQQFERAMNI